MSYYVAGSKTPSPTASFLAVLLLPIIYLAFYIFSTELVMGWVHPWVGLGWGSEFFLIFGGLGWVGWRLDCVIFLTS